MENPEDQITEGGGLGEGEGLAIPACTEAGGFLLRALGAIFPRGNKVKSILAALRKQG